ncbi:MAG: hypothetical protein L3J09_00025 [Flavobacteriaceae bacterium]|nr:hypothetical protein [Flavobacteriaceae bacterium]
MKNKVINLFDNAAKNDEVKYSELLHSFMSPFEKDFPDYFEIEDVYDFAINVWNIGNIAQNISPKEKKELLFDPEMPKELVKVHKELLNSKLEKFSQYPRFIVDFSIEEDNEMGFDLVVSTGNEKAYANSLRKRFEDQIDDNADFEDSYIDRYAVVLIPKQPFIDWINEIYPDENTTLNSKESNVYLVNNSFKDMEAWLKRNYKMFFMMELEDWSSDKKDWPKKQTYKMFQQWFSVSTSNLVYDIEQYPVSKE